MQEIKAELDPTQNDFRMRWTMFVSISVLGGLFLMGYGIACMRAKRSHKPNVQKLFGAK